MEVLHKLASGEHVSKSGIPRMTTWNDISGDSKNLLHQDNQMIITNLHVCGQGCCRSVGRV
jgi:hypothetical protein